MGSRMKENERIERAIRNLLKRPENRRCINCNSLGPQYVCTTFWTFVCTNCSGVHREFTHRIKSVSMATFTAEEVSALEASGNERARQTYFKEWDPLRNGYPDNSNLYKLRDFIKHIYVDRRYSGEGSNRLPRLKHIETEVSYGSRKVPSFSPRFGSPHCADGYERSSYERGGNAERKGDRSFKFNHGDSRSPRFAPQNTKVGGRRKSPVRFEVVDDRFRDDGGLKRYDGCSFSNRELKSTSQHDLRDSGGRSSPRVVRSMRDIFRINAPSLQEGDTSKVKERNERDQTQNQKTEASSPQQLFDESTAVQKQDNAGTIVDLLTDSEPYVSKTAPETQQMTEPSVSKAATGTEHMPDVIDGGIQSMNQVTSGETTPLASDANSLEALLFGISIPSPGNEGNKPDNQKSSLASMGLISNPPKSNDVFSASTTHIPTQSCGGTSGGSSAAIDGNGAPKISETEQLSKQHQLSASHAADVSFSGEQTAGPVMAQSIQPHMIPRVSKTEGPFGASVEQSSHDVSKPGSSEVGTESSKGETESTSRKELPEYLFTGIPPQVHVWPYGPPQGMGFNLQHYPNSVDMEAFPHAARVFNPFNDGIETNPKQAQFPSMASLQGVLPLSYAAMMLPWSPASSTMLSGAAYMAQQGQMNTLFSRAQEIGVLSIDGNIPGSTNPTQQTSGGVTAQPAQGGFPPKKNHPFE